MITIEAYMLWKKRNVSISNIRLKLIIICKRHYGSSKNYERPFYLQNKSSFGVYIEFLVCLHIMTFLSFTWVFAACTTLYIMISVVLLLFFSSFIFLLNLIRCMSFMQSALFTHLPHSNKSNYLCPHLRLVATI